MIVVGYPGIGKSTLANQMSVIDLESSWFKRLPDWSDFYVEMAAHLSKQHNVVMVSSHPEVIEKVILSDEKACMIYPSLKLENEWIKKVGERLLENPSQKNYRAYERAKKYFSSDIEDLQRYNIKKCEIDDINYCLKNIIDDIILKF